MTRRRLATATLAGVLLAGVAGAFAHQLKAALTTVRTNPRTELVEVVHRFYVHDAEQALPLLLGPGAAGGSDLYDDPAARLRFALYVHEAFRLSANDTALPLDLLGAEIEGEHLWIYQIGPVPAADARTLQVHQPALQELWPDQVNQVNVRLRGPVRTLEFRAGDAPGTLALP